ncbi:MAG: hypothetical protein HC927_00185 [Deltaproteobacteria bacterium]|nr:hypothetical protein [Deltaproteobacteria bacterium]
MAWFDGTDPATMNSQADGSGDEPEIGGDVLRWVSKVGDSYVKKTASATDDPTYTATGLTFPANARLQDPVVENWAFLTKNAAAFTVFLVVSPNDLTLISGYETILTTGATAPVFSIAVRAEDLGNSFFSAAGAQNVFADGVGIQPAVLGTIAYARTWTVGAGSYYLQINDDIAVTAANTAGALTGPAGGIMFGGNADLTLDFVGFIQHALFFNRQLTVAEIDQLQAHFGGGV